MIDWQAVENAQHPEQCGSDTYHVRISEICPDGKFKVTALAEYLQESAFRHSSRLNLGTEAFAGTSLAWVLARLGLYVRHYPGKGEAIRVETWYAGLTGRFGNRFYRLWDESNRVIACALTTFAMFDLSTRQIADWPDFVNDRMPAPGPRPLDFKNRKIPAPQTPQTSAPFHPRLGDIDLYNHVNNTKLIEWSLSACAQAGIEPFHPTVLDIVFRSECRLDDQVETQYSYTQSSDMEARYHVLLKKSDGTELVRAQITY